MSDSFTCPYCQKIFALHFETYSHFLINKEGHLPMKADASTVRIEYFICPSCGKISLFATDMGENTNFPKRQILPLSSSKQYPEYVPFQIRQDYQEAYSILELSPKASATLSRRCIQGMIHDKWHIVLKNLNQEISALKDKIDPTLWSAIDALRQLGNIGAHMEKDINVIVDIDSGEAHKLLALVEILIKDWYIVPHEREELLSSIVQINTDKQHERKKTE